MSLLHQILPLDNIQHLTLQACVLPRQEDTFPARFFQFSDTELKCDKAINLAKSLTTSLIEQEHSYSFSKDNQLELILLGETQIKQFCTLLKECLIQLHALNAVNDRNNMVSYRFNVTCDNLVNSRQLLAQFLQKHTLEGALIVNAPKLKTPGLLVMDMDSTTIKIECIDEIAKLAGVGQQVSDVTELAMQGKLDFAQSLIQRVATLENAPEKILHDVINIMPLMTGLETLIANLKKYHWKIAIASGGFTYFAEHLQNQLALDDVFANELDIQKGKLTGKVKGKIVDAKGKAEALLCLKDKYQIKNNQTLAMGDGANDLPMMKAAHLGVAFHAKPLVLQQADAAINYQGLDLVIHWLR